MKRQTITANERLQLIGLLTLAATHNARLNDIERAMIEITGDTMAGHTADAVYCDYSADDLLAKLGIAIDET